MVAHSNPGFPCRVSLQDADIGESVILINYEHLAVAGPYRSRHAIFVGEVASRMLEREGIQFLHVHNAKPGWFAARVDPVC